MPNPPRITAQTLIELKNHTSLTVAQIASATGVPLGTAQKIFAGITRTPHASTAKILYEYLEAISGAPNPEAGGSAGISPAPSPYEDNILASGASILREAPAGYSHVPPSSFDGNLVKSFRSPGEYTVEDYFAMPDTPRYELIDGYFYCMASPSAEHQLILVGLAADLYQYIREHGGACRVFAAPFDVQPNPEDDKTIVQPDVLVVCDPGKLTSSRLIGAPDLAVEILSPSTAGKDRTIKCTKYEEAGVREYWIIDPARRRVYVHFLEHKTPTAFYTFDDRVPVGIFESELSVCVGEYL